MLIKIFIENEAGSSKKNLFDEKTLEYKETVTVSAPYPFPYGFVINTTSGDGDNLDCFVLTNQLLKTGDVVEVNPVGMFEQIEDGDEDNKILAVIPGEKITIDSKVENIFRDFIKKVFSHKIDKIIAVGRFLGKEDAESLINRSWDE